MDPRRVTIDVSKPENTRLWSGTVRMAMDAIDTDGQRALLDQGFAFREDGAVLEVVGEDEEKVHQAMIVLKQWIDAWAKGQGIELAFTWRVRRYSEW
jgi:hypothetical protein